MKASSDDTVETDSTATGEDEAISQVQDENLIELVESEEGDVRAETHPKEQMNTKEPENKTEQSKLPNPGAGESLRFIKLEYDDKGKPYMVEVKKTLQSGVQ